MFILKVEWFSINFWIDDRNSLFHSIDCHRLLCYTFNECNSRSTDCRSRRQSVRRYSVLKIQMNVWFDTMTINVIISEVESDEEQQKFYEVDAFGDDYLDFGAITGPKGSFSWWAYLEYLRSEENTMKGILLGTQIILWRNSSMVSTKLHKWPACPTFYRKLQQERESDFIFWQKFQSPILEPETVILQQMQPIWK